jgi:hypothetical protein
MYTYGFKSHVLEDQEHPDNLLSPDNTSGLGIYNTVYYIDSASLLITAGPPVH